MAVMLSVDVSVTIAGTLGRPYDPVLQDAGLEWGDVDGLYDGDPSDPASRIIPTVSTLGDSIFALACGWIRPEVGGSAHARTSVTLVD